MKKGQRVSIPKELQANPGDDKRYLIYLGFFLDKHRFNEYQADGTPIRASWAFDDKQMKQLFPEQQEDEDVNTSQGS